jgi:type II secretion system protein N
MTENDATDQPSELTPPPQPGDLDKSWQKTLKRIAPFAAGFTAFILGLLIFAPLESYAYLALRQLGATGVHVEIGELKLSTFGKFKAQSIRIPLGNSGDNQAALKIAEAKGNIGLVAALRDKYNGKAEAVILSFSKGDIDLKIDSLEITADLEQKKSGGTTKALNGTISLQATAAKVAYKENKYLHEEIVVPFLQIVLKLRVQNNIIAIETGEAMGRLVNAQIKGSITLGPQTELNLNLLLQPTDEFYQKYQDKDPKTLLRFAGVLQDDGRIELNIKGTLAQPSIQAVSKPAIPGVVPPQR